jgi:hypothetical protein
MNTGQIYVKIPTGTNETGIRTVCLGLRFNRPDGTLCFVLFDDELVKSHIPYVVHASTKPVLSEPFVPSRASGRTVRRGAQHERNINRLHRSP